MSNEILNKRAVSILGGKSTVWLGLKGRKCIFVLRSYEKSVIYWS